MQISKGKVAAIHYTLTASDGQILDSSQGRDPLYYLHGVGNLIPGMEEGLEGKSTGDKFRLDVSPEKGYGAKNEKLIQALPRKSFGPQKIEKGMQFRAERGMVVTVVSVERDTITVDGNHPLAGFDLTFQIEVMVVREATADEISHGHVHGPGHHH